MRYAEVAQGLLVWLGYIVRKKQKMRKDILLSVAFLSQLYDLRVFQGVGKKFHLFLDVRV